MALPTEVAALMKALDTLQNATTSTNIASCSRAVARAADDLELICEETTDPSISTQLSSYIERARQAVTTARKTARAAALKADRAALIEPPTLEHSESQGTAGRLAAEINDALRATAAVVSEEIQRSKVAADVVDESTRRLKMTRDQHGVYAEDVASGGSTLKSIRRTDLIANCVLVLCFALFFVAAAYVANRRLQSSNIATFIVRPTYKVVSLPLRITAWLFKTSFSDPDFQPVRPRAPMNSDPPNSMTINRRKPPESSKTAAHISSDHAPKKNAVAKKPEAEITKLPHVSMPEQVSNVVEKRVSNVVEKRVSNVVKKRVSNVVKKRVSNVVRKRVSNVVDKRVSNVVDKRVSNVVKKRISNVVKKTVPNVVQKSAIVYPAEQALSPARNKIADEKRSPEQDQHTSRKFEQSAVENTDLELQCVPIIYSLFQNHVTLVSK